MTVSVGWPNLDGHLKESGPKWTVQRGGSGRSVQNWTVLSQAGWSFEPKWTVQDFWISGQSTFADRLSLLDPSVSFTTVHFGPDPFEIKSF